MWNANCGWSFYECDYGLVIATSRFTPEAQELAQETGVILVGEADLARLEFLIDG
ncbi:restriction endonuclease [Rhizobium sp.]|uniref:restriction endonuclease n=1 Tax=Rhizobium sp. TaxID=391 RepID=UPI0028AAD811